MLRTQSRSGLEPILLSLGFSQTFSVIVIAGRSPFGRLSPEEISRVEPPQGLINKLTNAPVLLLVFVDLSVVASFDSQLDRVGVISGASVYPFVWNILLAARNEGLGGTLTTFAVGKESEVQKLLGVPSHVAMAAMIPLGKPVKQLSKLKRKQVDEFAMLERWGGEHLG